MPHVGPLWRQHLQYNALLTKSTLTRFLDKISTGLDSSTTLLIVCCVRKFIHTLQVRPSTFPFLIQSIQFLSCKVKIGAI